MSTRDNKPLLDLDEAQTTQYADLLAAFEAEASTAYGEPKDRVLDKLSAVENFIASTAEAKGMDYTAHLPVMFNDQARSIDDHLEELIARRLETIRQAENDDDLRDIMIKAGSTFVATESAFVKPDQTIAAPAATGTRTGTGAQINIFDQRFKPVIEVLMGTKINDQTITFGDINVLEGVTDDNTLRNQPFNVIQIPKIGMEIAVCNLYGQSMLVSNQLHHPSFYESFSRPELRGLGLQSINFKEGWEGSLIDKLAQDWPEEELVVDMPEHIKDMAKKKAKIDITPELVAMTMLYDAAFREDADSTFPSKPSKDRVPFLPNDTFANIIASSRKGLRNMPEPMSAAAIKRYYGWTDSFNRPQTEKIAADIATFKERFEENGEYVIPEPVISIEEAVLKSTDHKIDLSPEIVGMAVLWHAAFRDQSEPLIATPRSKNPIPFLPGDTFALLENAGRNGMRNMPEKMDLGSVKRYYGWMDQHNILQKDKIDQDVKTLTDQIKPEDLEGLTPEQMLEKLKPVMDTILKPVLSMDEAITRGFEVRTNLTPELIGQALLWDAAFREENDGTLASAHTDRYVPFIPDSNFAKINSAGSHGTYSLQKGLSLVAVKRYYGWADEHNRPITEKIEADTTAFKAHYEQTEELLPLNPVMSLEEAIDSKYEKLNLTSEIIATALLWDSAFHEDSDGIIASLVTKRDIPFLPGDTFKNLDSAGAAGVRQMPTKGLTLAILKQDLGWTKNSKETEQFATDLADFEAKVAELPDGEDSSLDDLLTCLSDDLKTRIAASTQEHVAANEQEATETAENAEISVEEPTTPSY